jgi:hypothetical protein
MHFILLAGGLMLTPVPPAVILLCIFYLRRFLWRRKQCRGKNGRGFYPTVFSLGLAFQLIQLFAEPGQKHVIVERLKENASEDDEGGPESPTTYFDRQLRSIRRGEEVDVLKVPLRHSRFGG